MARAHPGNENAMTQNRKAKADARERANATGESYTAARRHTAGTSFGPIQPEKPEPVILDLPDRVHLDWSTIDVHKDVLPFGYNDGTVSFDPNIHSHLLIAGASGSGKTEAAKNLLYGAAVHGADLYVVDAVKDGIEYREFQPYVKAVATSAEEASAMMRWIGDEIIRRKDLIREHAVASCRDLPANLQPTFTVVLVEQFNYLLTPTPVLQTPSSDPDRENDRRQMVLENEAKSHIAATLGRVAKEGDALGITVILTSQRLTAKMLGLIDGGHYLRGNISRLLLGRASNGDRASALQNFVDAAELGGHIPAGRGLFESDGPATPVQVWWDHGQNLFAKNLAERLTPIPLNDKLDLAALIPSSSELQARFKNQELEDRWQQRWSDILMMGARLPVPQHSVYAEAQLPVGPGKQKVTINSQPMVLPHGVPVEEYLQMDRPLEPALATTLLAAPFVSVTGVDRLSGVKPGDRHLQAIAVRWCESILPITPQGVIPSDDDMAAGWLLAGLVDTAFDKVKLARPQLIDATPITAPTSSSHLWKLKFKLYGAVTADDVLRNAEKLKTFIDVDYFRVVDTGDRCVTLVAGAKPTDQGFEFAKASGHRMPNEEFIASLDDPHATFKPESAAERWARRWSNVIGDAANMSIVHQPAVTTQRNAWKRSTIQSESFVFGQGLTVDRFVNRDVEAKLATTLKSAPFVSVTGITKDGGARHPGAFTVHWSEEPQPADLSEVFRLREGRKSIDPDAVRIIVGKLLNDAFDIAGIERADVTSVFFAPAGPKIISIRGHLNGLSHGAQLKAATELIDEVLAVKDVGFTVTGRKFRLQATQA